MHTMLKHVLEIIGKRPGIRGLCRSIIHYLFFCKEHTSKGGYRVYLEFYIFFQENPADSIIEHLTFLIQTGIDFLVFP